MEEKVTLHSLQLLFLWGQDLPQEYYYVLCLPDPILFADSSARMQEKASLCPLLLQIEQDVFSRYVLALSHDILCWVRL